MMMRVLFAATLLTAGCGKGAVNDDPFDPDAIAVLPDWIETEMADAGEDCSSSPYWNDGAARIATTYYAGSYVWDGDDLFGNEFWMLWPDNDFAATGFVECTVVWDVFGTRTEATGAADYGVRISASVDEDQTTCEPDLEGRPIYAGEESFTVDYDVVESSNGTVGIFFATGTELGRGEWNNNGFDWLSEKDCKAF